jgi:hypothetical protein
VLDLSGLGLPGCSRLIAWLRGPREVVNDSANDLDERDISRHQCGLRSVSEAIF